MPEGKTMKYLIVLALVLVVMEQDSSAQLYEMIEKNVKQSAKSYEQVVSSSQEKSEKPRLWIHVRSRVQEKMVLAASNWLQGITLGKRTIDLRPVQSVDAGPPESQLRYFKTRDKNEAEQLFRELKKALPRLQLKDFSRQNQGLDWLKPGHYELWLAPDVSRFNIP